REAMNSAAGDRAQAPSTSQEPTPAILNPPPSTGTVVLDAELGGILVPSFLGKSVRAAIEMSQESGLDLDAVGSGLAKEQSPVPGTPVVAGSRVTVKFGR